MVLCRAEAVFTHGDMGADQLLVDGPAGGDRLDSGERDPHADWASSRPISAAGRSTRAGGADGARGAGGAFNLRRFRWQLAAAEARRV